MSSTTQVVITPDALLEHWQGHRRVTRRLIDAFPEDKLFTFSGKASKTKAELLRLWDADTAEINRLWPTIPQGRFQERDVAFGQWEMPIYGLLLYIIDNEIHHRGQGFAYLRALGIAPPPFYDRS